MKKYLFVFLVLALVVRVPISGQTKFSPEKDGWHFENWGEEGPNCIGSCDFSWDLFRKTYLGIYPNNNPVAAPLDCGFYEIFKNCAEKGNCGGMSVLALALFKYGGSLGFCSPAKFYTGTKAPDREDLHRAINTIQARQFSASGISRFIDAVDRGTLNNAVAAYDNVEEQLASGDYPVIWIATDTLGDAAHTVIPYHIEEYGGQKTMYIWDSNHPYDDNQTRYDNNTENKLIINGPTDWSYTSGSTSYDGGGWCLCVPMSDILRKSRHPFAVDIAIETLQTLFVGGPGATVSQINDEEGHRLYNNNNDIHTSFSELETDPNKRIKGLVRWPWLGQGKEGKLPGELYFIQAPRGDLPDLEITLSGKKYNTLIHVAGNLIEIDSDSSMQARDIIKLRRMATEFQSIEINTTGIHRKFNIKKLRSDIGTRNYRSFNVKNLILDPNVPVNVSLTRDFKDMEISSKDKTVDFELNIIQSVGGKTTVREVRDLSTSPGKLLRISPKNWKKLDSTEIIKKVRLKRASSRK
jgi:hypothetical protein